MHLLLLRGRRLLPKLLLDLLLKRAGDLGPRTRSRFAHCCRRRGPSFILSLLALVGCGTSFPAADAGFVSRWTGTHYALARAERLNPPAASRWSAYAAIALYEGWAAFSDSLQSLAGQLNGLDSLPRPEPRVRHDPAIVAMEAQAVVLLSFYETGFASTSTAIRILHDSLIDVRRSAGVPQKVIDRSVGYGTRLGEAILAWAATDGFRETRGKTITLRSGPGYWVPTATPADYRAQNLSGKTDMIEFDNPTASGRVGQTSDRGLIVNRPRPLGAAMIPGLDITKPVEPYWGSLRPFALQSADSCSARPPYEYSADKGSPFYRMVDSVYRKSLQLTQEEKDIAFFWADNPGETGTPSGHWLGIISQLAAQLNLSPERIVEAYALSAIAMADAFIVCWRLKYEISLLRPVTYIKRHIDPYWTPLLVTPPFPEFASGHAIQSAATADVLTALLGDNTPFNDATHVTLGHPPRHFNSFREAAEQVALSRYLGGIHYMSSDLIGADQGRCIARHLLARVHTRRSTSS